MHDMATIRCNPLQNLFRGTPVNLSVKKFLIIKAIIAMLNGYLGRLVLLSPESTLSLHASAYITIGNSSHISAAADQTAHFKIDSFQKGLHRFMYEELFLHLA